MAHEALINDFKFANSNKKIRKICSITYNYLQNVNNKQN